MPVKRLLAIATLLVSIGALSAQATVRYVNRDSACPGTGTSGSPYCSIQNAFNVAVAGDDIRIIKASSPYDEHAVAASSGTSSAQITVESDNAANQAIVRYSGAGTVAGALQFIDKNYWTIQNLIFDGTGVNTSTMAVWIGLNNTARWSSGPDLTGFKVLNNTFKNWGGTEAQESAYANQSALNAVLISGGYGAPVGAFTISGTLVQGNVFDGDRMIPLGMTSTKNSTVQNNEIKNTTCGRAGSGGTGLAVVADGIKIQTGTVNFATTDLYKNNTIHDFQSPGSCGLTLTGDGYWEWDGLHTDVYPINGTIDGNTIYNIDPTNIHNGGGTGLHIEAGSFGWTIKNNIIYNIGYDGILNNQQTGSGTPNKYLNNTIYNIARNGIELRWGYATVEDNIIDNAGSTQAWVQSGAVSSGGITIDYNDYWDSSGGSKAGSWNGGGVVNFSTWKSQCGCDSHSINANPLFVDPPSDFHLQASSPVLTAGLGGTFMGALGAAAGALPNISSLTASPSSIYPTQSSMLSWNTSGATSLSIDQGIGTVTGTTSKPVTPSSTTTYTLTATNSTGSVTAKTTVAIGPPVISSFTANPATISAGQSSTLSWSISGATTLSIDQGVGIVTGTSRVVSPAISTTYTLTASNTAGSTTAKVSITIGGALPIISSFTASPSSIYPTQSSTLSWNTSGATSLSIDQGIGTVTGTTSKSVTPSSTTTYTLTATNSNGSVTAKMTVIVSPPVISSFTANPATISAGQSSTLSWSVTGATSLSIDQGIGTITGTSHVVSPATTTTYTLTAGNSAGSTTAKVSVTVGSASSSGKVRLILE